MIGITINDVIAVLYDPLGIPNVFDRKQCAPFNLQSAICNLQPAISLATRRTYAS